MKLDTSKIILAGSAIIIILIGGYLITSKNNDTIDSEPSPEPIQQEKVIVRPEQEMITFADTEFGPLETSVDPNTSVLTLIYPRKGESAGYADEEITFNFYLSGKWAEADQITPQNIAYLIRDSVGEETEVESIFEAPDPTNSKPAFFITLTSVYPEEGYGQVFLIKVAELEPEGTGSYSVIFTKTIHGDPDITRDDLQHWLIDNAEIYSPAVISPNMELESTDQNPALGGFEVGYNLQTGVITEEEALSLLPGAGSHPSLEEMERGYFSGIMSACTEGYVTDRCDDAAEYSREYGLL